MSTPPPTGTTNAAGTDVLPGTDVAALAALMHGRRLAVLTGAGISVDSGIPDYRGPTTRHIARNPVQHDDFVRSAEARQRYWSRASRGYLAVSGARANPAHLALAALEAAGHLTGVITQNVDGLHQAAGSRHVVELHGSMHRVVCLACAKTYPRATIQRQIRADNPGFIRAAEALAPDGDAAVAKTEQAAFRTPHCRACGGVLMPDVVFFGGSVPKAWSGAAYELLAGSDGLLVVGSSLTVFSGYRFVREASKQGKPVAIVTLGETRGHKHAAVAIDGEVGRVLPELVGAVNAPPPNHPPPPAFSPSCVPPSKPSPP